MGIVIPLASLRPDPVTLTELEWFFTRAESDLGLRSNFLTGDTHGGDGGDVLVEARRLAAVARERVCHAAFRRLRPGTQRTLADAFRPRQWPPQVQEAFGWLAGVVYRLPAAVEAYEARKVPSDTLEQVASQRAGARLCAFRAQAMGLVVRACREYAQARAVAA